jgi:hypothetical protein
MEKHQGNSGLGEEEVYIYLDMKDYRFHVMLMDSHKDSPLPE